MNNEQIEKILRNPPAIKTPGGLLEKLTEDIQLPRAQSERAEWVAATPWFKRWLPALSFVIIFLGCLVALAVQTNLLSGLRGENDKLRAEQGNLEGLRAQNTEVQRLRNENQELERLRRDNQELNELREEVARLRTQTQDLPRLRKENTQLLAAVESSLRASQTNGDFFAESQVEAERIHCVNNLKQIGLAARIWAGDHNGLYPTNFICMSNELATCTILKCPSDKSQSIASSFAQLDPRSISYQMDAPGILEDYPQVIYVECPIHHNVCLVDGSVQQLGGNAYQQHVKMWNGLKTFFPGR